VTSLGHAFATSTNFTAQVALDFLNKGDFEQAEVYINKAISSSPNDLKNYWAMFEIYKQQERFKAALIPLEEIQKRSTHTDTLLLCHLIECRFKSGMFIDAIRTKTYFPANYKLPWETRYYLAMSYYRTHQYDEAIFHFNHLLETMDGNMAKGKWNLLLGNCYRESGNHVVARKYYQDTLDYIPSPWAIIWLAAYAIEDEEKDTAYEYLNRFVTTCDVPNLINFIRADQLRDLFYEERFFSELSIVKNRCLAFFSDYESSKATVVQRVSRVKCLTTFCIFFELGAKNDQMKFSEGVKAFLVELGYSKLDIYLELARLSLFNGDVQKSESYLRLALQEEPYPFFESELLSHCLWLRKNLQYQNDPRFGFELELKKMVEELDPVVQ